ncbi:hypothetical protein B0G81_2198 [Paraburkholderia sp. BL6665CI2N2]|uniref:hypothetical protein n=1 Tax=Paraburkholderia sp. BL6665CI2N2 TaxID=1938806 RepID=UPI001065C596|nr:hypothetical protein [Paraburkholderia sp. BL6665CI2N2]TDY21955.1 hypothetical protein B0G81_2198 [Paraburkholderia sp. BL6665CI2N2]
MEQVRVAERCSELTRQSLLPIKVSDGAFFHVRYSRNTDDATESAFIAHTYDSVRTLLAASNCATPAVYLCSKTVGGDMAVRRIALIRKIPHTGLCILEFEDGRGVLWDESRYLGAVSCYVEIDTPQSVGQLATIAARLASTSNAECEPNDARQDGG